MCSCNGKMRDIRSIQDYEWGSVGQYMRWVEHVLGLVDIDSSHVLSFPLGKLGVEKLVARKLRTEAVLRDNLEKISTFVQNHENELQESERVVLRTIYRQTLNWAKTCEEHAACARGLGHLSQKVILEEEKYELPF